MNRARQVLFQGFGIVTLGAGLLLLLEGGLRFGLRLQEGEWPQTEVVRFYNDFTTARRLYRLHPYLNTAPREGAQVEAFGRGATFNSHGYRSPERPKEKPVGVYRILCVGGSTTFDILADNDTTSWPWLLEQNLLNAGRQVEVWNAGFPGWTSLENLLSYSLRDGDLKPDLVLFFQGINDLQPLAHTPFDSQYESGHAELARRALGFDHPPIPWLHHSILLERLRGLLGTPEPMSTPSAMPTTDQAAESSRRRRELDPQAVAVYQRRLRSFAFLAEGHGAKLLWIPQTLRIRSNHKNSDLEYIGDWIPGLDPALAPEALVKLNEIMQELDNEDLGIRLDLGFTAPTRAPNTELWPDSHWGDPMHFSPAGSRQFADFLADEILAQLSAQGADTSSL